MEGRSRAISSSTPAYRTLRSYSVLPGRPPCPTYRQHRLEVHSTRRTPGLIVYSHAMRRKSTPRGINSLIPDSKSHLSRKTVSPSTSPRRALPLHPVSRLSSFSMAVPSSSALRRDHTIHRSISLIEPFKPTIHSSSSRSTTVEARSVSYILRRCLISSHQTMHCTINSAHSIGFTRTSQVSAAIRIVSPRLVNQPDRCRLPSTRFLPILTRSFSR